MIINTTNSILCKKIIFAFLYLLLIGTSLFAQTDTSGEAFPNLKTAQTTTTTTTYPSSYEVLSATSSDPKNPNQIGLEEIISLKIRNTEELFREAHNARILLYINNMPVKDAIAVHKAGGIDFFLPHEGDVIDVWNNLIEMRGKNEFFLKKVAITVGIEGKEPIATKVKDSNNNGFTLILVKKMGFYSSLAGILVMISIFLILAKKTDMLRDTGLPPPTGRKPYSLSRMQMAVWFIVIISSWLLLYVCLHRFNNLSESILILMGITAGTSVGCVALDTNKTSSQCSPSKGFFTDLVTYNSSVSLFRFQNVAWTVVLVAVFIRTVFFYLKMPDFDSTLLLLMGISSGTYIGGKVTEKKDENTSPSE